MKTKRQIVTALMLAVSALGALSAASADETAIRELTATFVAAWNNHDPAAMAATWAEDGDLINPVGVVAKGRAAVQELLVKEHSRVMKTTTLEITSLDLRMISSAIALGDWSIVITGMAGPDGATMPPRNLHVFHVYKQHDGKWLTAAWRPYAFAPTEPPSRHERSARPKI
jgi:uncharacterized protein (TIGR02246 family)